MKPDNKSKKGYSILLGPLSMTEEDYARVQKAKEEDAKRFAEWEKAESETRSS